MRKLSSDRTTFHKVIAVLLVAVLIGVGAALFVWQEPHLRRIPLVRFQTLLMEVLLAGMAWYLYKVHIRAKEVFFDGERLHIAARGRNVVVPLDEVDKVWSDVRNPWPVFVRFRRRTEYGRRITFFPAPPHPPARWFRFSQHPLAHELQALVEEASNPRRTSSVRSGT
jgi:hypothetical protein